MMGKTSESKWLGDDKVKLYLKKARASKRRGSSKMHIPPSVVIAALEELVSYHNRFPEIQRQEWEKEESV